MDLAPAAPRPVPCSANGQPSRRTPRARRCAAPTRSPAAVSMPARPRRARSSGSASSRAIAARRPRAGSARASGSSRRRRRSRGCRARRCRRPRAPVAIASSGGSAKPSWVEVCTNTVAWLNSSLTRSSSGELHVASCRARSASSGSIPNRHSSGRGCASARQASSVSGRFFSGFERPSASTMSSRRATSARGRNVSRSMPGRDQLGVEAELAQALAVPGGDRHVAELGAVGVEHRVAGALVVGVVGGLDVLHEVHGDAARDARAPHRRRGHPPGRDLDRIERRERADELVVVGEAVHRARAARTTRVARRACTARRRGRGRPGG